MTDDDRPPVYDFEGSDYGRSRFFPPGWFAGPIVLIAVIVLGWIILAAGSFLLSAG